MNIHHSCKRVAELLSQSLDGPLDWFDKLRLRLHMLICGDCRHVEQQMLGMKTLSADLFSSGLALGDEGSLPPSPVPNPSGNDS